jgi:hypothetical protein
LADFYLANSYRAIFSFTFTQMRSLVFLRKSIWALLLPGLLGSACTTVEVDSYRLVQDSVADQAYVREGADFSHYRSLYPQPLEIYYTEAAGSPAPENLERMRAIFRRIFLAELDGEYEITDKPAEDALGIRASLVDLRGSVDADDEAYTGRLRNLVTNDQLTFFMELSDSMTGVVLARAADLDRSESEVIDSPESIRDSVTVPWPRVEAAAARWAAMFHEFLDESLGH